MPHLLAAPDKFKGTAGAGAVASAVADAARAEGWTATELPLSDGGDGLLEVFGGPNRTTEVTGPLGTVVRAPWRLDGEHAVIESALASGLVLAGGAEDNDPMTATSRGTGELIAAAVASGARSLLVGIGGSAMTDGGLGALDALPADLTDALARDRVEIVVCCDVRTRYEDAARVFGPQKGAGPDQVRALTDRLRDARRGLLDRFGVDVATIDGSGAAGGLGGALAAVGATLRPGFDLVADRVGLGRALAAADLVVTGEGRFDASSLEGKVVGRVAELASTAGVDVLAVVGEAAARPDFDVVALAERFGRDRALRDPLALIAAVVGEELRRRSA